MAEKDKQYTPGTILKNKIGQFTKVVSVKNGVYGLSGWTTLKNAEKATVARVFVNKHGTRYAGCTVEKEGKKVKESAPASNDANTDPVEKATGPKLKELLKANDLPVSGTVAELRERVRENDLDTSSLA